MSMLDTTYLNQALIAVLQDMLQRSENAIDQGHRYVTFKGDMEMALVREALAAAVQERSA
jgi:hypothetical protein